jgi:hypothetical protein
MPLVTTFLLRALLIAAGLVLAASLAIAFVLMLAFWSVRAAWARLTGRPVSPFIIRIDPRGGFERMYRRTAQRGRRAETAPPRQAGDDVTDVEPRQPRG